MLRAGALTGLGFAAGGCGLFAGEEKPPPPPPNPATRPAEPVIDGDVVVANWPRYLAPELVGRFEAEYGVSVVESHFDSMVGLLGRLRAGNKYDVVFATAQVVDRLRRTGDLHVIDPSRLTNAGNVVSGYPYLGAAWYDPGFAYALPYTVRKTGLLWRTDQLGPTLPGSWADLWDARARGRTYLLGHQDEALGMAALRLGYDVNTSEPAELTAIVDLLRQLLPLLASDGFADDGLAKLLDGTAWLHQAWSSDLARVLRNPPPGAGFGFETPVEGAPIGVDAMVVPANAAHPGSGLVFIDYLLRVDNARRNIEYLGNQMPVAGTEATYSAMVAAAPGAVVTAAEVARGPYFRPGDDAATRRRTEAFAQIRSGLPGA